jgi:hypothetical protein
MRPATYVGVEELEHEHSMSADGRIEMPWLLIAREGAGCVGA